MCFCFLRLLVFQQLRWICWNQHHDFSAIAGASGWMAIVLQSAGDPARRGPGTGARGVYGEADGNAAVAATGRNACVDREDGGGLIVLRSEEHTSELQSLRHLVCRLLLE